MYKCCRWCHKLYDTEDNYIHIKLRGEKHRIKDMVFRNKEFYICKDCMSAFIRGYSFYDKDVELID